MAKRGKGSKLPSAQKRGEEDQPSVASQRSLRRRRGPSPNAPPVKRAARRDEAPAAGVAPDPGRGRVFFGTVGRFAGLHSMPCVLEGMLQKAYRFGVEHPFGIQFDEAPHGLTRA